MDAEKSDIPIPTLVTRLKHPIPIFFCCFFFVLEDLIRTGTFNAAVVREFTHKTNLISPPPAHILRSGRCEGLLIPPMRGVLRLPSITARNECGLLQMRFLLWISAHPSVLKSINHTHHSSAFLSSTRHRVIIYVALSTLEASLDQPQSGPFLTCSWRILTRVLSLINCSEA